MRVAMLSWESLHSIPVGGVGVHVTELAAALEREGHEVHVFTRMRHNQPHYELIHGVHYHRCPFDLHPNFVDEVNNMCRSFVHHVFQTENCVGPFDIIHAHDWLAANAMIWIEQGRGRKCVCLPSTRLNTDGVGMPSPTDSRRASASRSEPAAIGRTR
jgi:glycogen synthase